MDPQELLTIGHLSSQTLNQPCEEVNAHDYQNAGSPDIYGFCLQLKCTPPVSDPGLMVSQQQWAS